MLISIAFTELIIPMEIRDGNAVFKLKVSISETYYSYKHSRKSWNILFI